jgi:hypothetical protein
MRYRVRCVEHVHSVLSMDVASPTASTGMLDVLARRGRVVGSLGVVSARAGCGRGITVSTPARGVRDAVVRTRFMRFSLVVLYLPSFVRVGDRSLVCIAVPASAAGVTFLRVGTIARDVARDTSDDIAEGCVVWLVVRSVAGAGAGVIDVTCSAAAG